MAPIEIRPNLELRPPISFPFIQLALCTGQEGKPFILLSKEDSSQKCFCDCCEQTFAKSACTKKTINARLVFLFFYFFLRRVLPLVKSFWPCELARKDSLQYFANYTTKKIPWKLSFGATPDLCACIMPRSHRGLFPKKRYPLKTPQEMSNLKTINLPKTNSSHPCSIFLRT